jgi:SAM-dependent methyltransferase
VTPLPDDPSVTDATHYSYTVYADPAMAERFDALRFSGPIGELLAETQERVLFDFLREIQGRPVLDVGTGTGRAALALAGRGAHVTAVDASDEMLRVARARAKARQVTIGFDRADAHALPFQAASFDAVVCLRVLMHTPDWRQCLAELCRVASHRVVFDYPALASAAAIQSAGRRVLHAFGASVEPYRVLTERAVRAELTRHGFRLVAAHRQFVLPIGLHKALASRSATERIEGALAGAGLLDWLGSPVTVLAER